MVKFFFAKDKVNDLPFFRHFTLISLCSVILLNLSVLEFGFDNSLTSLVQAMDRASFLSSTLSCHPMLAWRVANRNSLR